MLFFGGIDCDLADDSDLLLPERTMEYATAGNGWTTLSNLSSRVSAIEDELSNDGSNLTHMSERRGAGRAPKKRQPGIVKGEPAQKAK